MKISLLRMERLFGRLAKIWTGLRGSPGQLYVWDRVEEYCAMWQAVAKELGAEMTPLAADLWEISRNGKKTRILNDKLEYDNPVSLIMAGRKHLVYSLLEEGGLRVPDYKTYKLEEYRSVAEFLNRHPAGCVVKPVDGTSSGQGVTTHVTTLKEVKKASILASLYCPQIMIEPMIAGECYRLLVLRGEVIHAVCRRGLRLQGDGVSTVEELMGAAAMNIDIDRDCLFTLGYQGLSLEGVPADTRSFLVKSVAETNSKQVELRTVYNADVTDSVCAALRRDALRAAELVGCEFVGVDFITTDCRVPLQESGGYINELNTTPGLHHHCGYGDGEYASVALRAIAPLLQAEDESADA